jgi:hypothetical protein
MLIAVAGLDEIFKFVILLLKNALAPILVTVMGIVIDGITTPGKLKDLLNALLPIVITELPIVTEVK